MGNPRAPVVYKTAFFAAHAGFLGVQHAGPLVRQISNCLADWFPLPIERRDTSPMDSLRIRRATAAHLPFIMATERQSGYEELVGHWDEQHHLAALGDSRFAYFLGEIDGTDIGFVIVRDWASAERVTCVQRIAVVRPGFGTGKRLLAAVVHEIFQTTHAHRVWLGVFPENQRARRAYEAVGFQPEGVARGSAFFGGKYRDELIMSILRHEWHATPNSASVQS